MGRGGRKKGTKPTQGEASGAPGGEDADWVLVEGGSKPSNSKSSALPGGRDSSNDVPANPSAETNAGEKKKKRKRKGRGGSSESQSSDKSKEDHDSSRQATDAADDSSTKNQAGKKEKTANARRHPGSRRQWLQSAAAEKAEAQEDRRRLFPLLRQFVTVFLLGALTALSVWLYIDLIIVAEEASQIRPFTERAAHVAAEAHHRAAEVAMELQHSLDDISSYMEGMFSANKKHFRMRIWGTVTMMQKLLLDKQCWLDHVMLDKETGLDPEGIKLRAATGLEAADYLFPGYWVWGKLIQNFADIGYDSNNLFMAAYDWRLSFKGLQQRDQYFTKLKHMVELAYDTNNHRKVVILTHSMGSNVLLYFLNWVQADPATNGGDGGGESSEWVDKYIESWVNIAGPMLGVPKALASLSSGEMRDTAQLGALETYVMENFFSRRQRAEMLRSWGSIASMLPKGGDYIWGNSTFAPDGVVVKGHMISFEPHEREETIEDEALRAELENDEPAVDDVNVDANADVTVDVVSGGSGSLLGVVGAEATGVVDPLTIEAQAVNTSSLQATTPAKPSSGSDASVQEVMRRTLKKMKSSISNNKNKKRKRSASAPSPAQHALVRNVTMGDAIEWMIKVADDPHFERYIRSVYSYGAETDGRKLLIGPREAKYWSNPLESSLPNAPHMKIYCFYGVGKGAERAYVYRHTDLADELQQTVKEHEVGGLVGDLAGGDGDDGQVKAGEAGGQDIEEEEHDVPFRINNEVNDPENDLVSGVQDSQGDGTVPLMSLGYMCVEGWKREDYPYNPAGIKVLTREYPHQPSSVFSDIRGGPATADHVDIMGNYEMTIDILRLVSNQANKVEERIVSPIKDYARGVDLRWIDVNKPEEAN
ncbi:Lecithin:cholesterol acyltransferase [Acanthamoeba castellanii str. Neff]|uniref:Lecithin:cholesterol acyltransferase n=1 Tax=Acanthamoeba castellanii (strain ATCC 30010 / Neff) TaxID=1257118 RepID=L8HF90_ACACF|nr:Lecithin:cholesterol acyltransferase [Acanthamoeba castellanii str. Neff]ELR23917.1 Lecithin:cholesterol acyltransferase [Acanthamoeba castellanii str. Neff]